MEREDAAEVVLSEERAQVGTRKVPVELVRVRKRVVSRTRTITVEERREELSIERVALPVGGPAFDDAQDVGDEVVVVLREEVAEVVTRVVPVEQVRVRRERVTETATVDTQLRREQAEIRTDPAQP